MFKTILFVGIFHFSVSTNAQQTGRMETDRPDQTECPFITKLHYFQIETGVSFGKQDRYSTLALPTVLSKYGLTKYLELRLNTELDIIQTPILLPSGNEVNFGLAPIEVGAKLSLCEEKGIRPKTSVLFHVGVPKLASKKFQANKWSPSLILLAQNDLSEKVGIGYNIGWEWDGETDDPYLVYTISAGINMGKKWYSFFEFFGASRKNEPAQSTVDTGIACYLNDNVKIDLSGGFGISRAAIDYFIGMGISFRFR